MHWDVFCRVIDNHGDLGVCWRLAADLAARGEHVRLWVDAPGALQWMAPAGHERVEVRNWPPADAAIEPGDVVVEAFGCELPPALVRRMASRPRAPVWINLEYLSAEAFVERAHKLPSPQLGGAGAGLRKWFFYPGFTPRTGGLIREVDLFARRQAFDAPAWLSARGLVVDPGEQIVSLFCYDQPALPAVLDQLAQERPTLLLVTAGAAAQQVEALLGPGLKRGALRARLLPALPQCDYDHLLWAADLNFVRGEDSFVRAQWAGQPFVWQIYPQHDGAHTAKLDAFLARFLAGADALLADRVASFWRAWNAPDAPPQPLPPLPPLMPWRNLCTNWRAGLLAQPDLVTQLLGFVAESR